MQRDGAQLATTRLACIEATGSAEHGVRVMYLVQDLSPLVACASWGLRGSDHQRTDLHLPSIVLPQKEKKCPLLVRNGCMTGF
jgi:hypothetical protein